MRSMTGFGRGQSNREGLGLTVEVKTVNHRYLDLSVRLPKALSSLEVTLRKRLAERFVRGRIEACLYPGRQRRAGGAGQRQPAPRARVRAGGGPGCPGGGCQGRSEAQCPDWFAGGTDPGAPGAGSGNPAGCRAGGAGYRLRGCRRGPSAGRGAVAPVLPGASGYLGGSGRPVGAARRGAACPDPGEAEKTAGSPARRAGGSAAPDPGSRPVRGPMRYHRGS